MGQVVIAQHSSFAVLEPFVADLVAADVILRPSNIPDKAKQRDNTHLAEGESTGHFHDAVGAGLTVLEYENDLYLDAPNGASVTHQEHKTIDVPPGKYKVSKVREYDHFAEEIYEVRD